MVAPDSTPRIDVDAAFATCVRDLGGLVLDDVRGFRSHEKADYYFPNWQVVAELKCLRNNTEESQSFRRKAWSLYRGWISHGFVPPPVGRVMRIDLKHVPRSCAEEFINLMVVRLGSVVQHANAQLAATIRTAPRPEKTSGLLIICGDGDISLPPDMLVPVLARVFQRDALTAIHSLICFTANHLVRIPRQAFPSLFWLDPGLPNRNPVPQELRDAIKESWFKTHSRAISGALIEFEGSPNDIMGTDYDERIQRRRTLDPRDP